MVSFKLSKDGFTTDLHSVPYALSLVKFSDATVVEVNDRFLDLYDFHGKEVLGKTITELSLWELPDQNGNLIENIGKTRQGLNLEAEIRKPSGKVINCQVTAEIIEIGTVEYILVLTRDLTERKKAEQELKRYEHIVRATDGLMAFIDMDYIYRAANDSYLEASGKSFVEVVGHTIPEVVGEDDFNKYIKRNIDRCLSGESLRLQRWADMPGWGECFLDIAYSPHKDNNGKITGVVFSGHDITDRKRAEEALKRSEELLRSYFNAGFVGMAIVSPNYKFTQINDTVRDILGYSHKHLIGLNIADITYPDENENPRRLFNDVITGKIDGYSEEKNFIKKDGSVIAVSISMECVRKDDGSVDYLVAFFQDITKRKQAEQELRKSEASLRKAQQLANLGFWEVNLINDQVYLSDEIYSICGFNRYIFDHKLQSLLKIIHPDDYEPVTKARDAAIEENTPFNIEYRIYKNENEMRYVEVQAEVLRDENRQAVRMVGSLQDITDRKLAEIALSRSNRALRVLNECTHTIVHAASGQEMINEVCKIIVDTGGYRFVWVGYAQSDETKSVYPVAKAGYEAGYLDNDFSWNKDVKPLDPVSDVIMTGKLAVIKNLTEEDSYGPLRNSALERGYRSEIALPLNVGDRPFGAIMIYSSEPDAFDREEVKLLRNLADDLAFGILSLHTRQEHERSERLLIENENKYRLLYDENPAMFFTVDEHGIILTVNKFGAQELGYSVDDLIGTSIFELSYESYKQASENYLYAWLESPIGVHRWEQQMVRNDGSIIWVRETAHVIVDNEGLRNILMVCEDITEARELSDQLTYQATHDSLTGLFNRGEFEERLNKLLVSTRIENTQHALCYLDMDQFKIINDTCGHIAGDELLRQFGVLLMGKIRKRDTVARFGGDEFVILMEHCPLHRAEFVARKILRAIDDYQFIWGRNKFRLGASFGIVPINSSSGNVTDLLINVDRACYTAKEKGRNRLHILHEDETAINEKYGEMRRVTEIQNALDEGRFLLYFQLIDAIKIRKKQYDRYEVLVRMKNSSGHILTPDSFMPIAERYNLSVDIDRWIINELFILLVELKGQDQDLPQFFINLSGHSIGDNDLLEFILQKLDQFSIPPEHICFEVTESVAITNLTNAKRFINVLRDKGCFFALDDFGSGISSYAYLKDLKVDFLKIDGQFVRGIETDPVNLAIVRSIHDIGTALGKLTIAEYIEDAKTCEILREIGIDYGQGKYIDTEHDFEELCRKNSAKVIEFSKKQ